MIYLVSIREDTEEMRSSVKKNISTHMFRVLITWYNMNRRGARKEADANYSPGLCNSEEV